MFSDFAWNHEEEKGACRRDVSTVTDASENWLVVLTMGRMAFKTRDKRENSCLSPRNWKSASVGADGRHRYIQIDAAMKNRRKKMTQHTVDERDGGLNENWQRHWQIHHIEPDMHKSMREVTRVTGYFVGWWNPGYVFQVITQIFEPKRKGKILTNEKRKFWAKWKWKISQASRSCHISSKSFSTIIFRIPFFSDGNMVANKRSLTDNREK